MKLAGQGKWGMGWAVSLLGAVIVMGCDRVPVQPDAKAIALGQQAVPADAALAAIYERSCRACHSQQAAQAPLVGFGPHWEARLAQGMPTLLQHAKDGFKGMPARGYCNDCSDQDFEGLIRFMSSTK